MHDLIDRQAAIDALLAVTGNSSVRELYEHVQEHGLSDMWSGGVNAAIDIIIAVPSAQPERTGKWIKTNNWGRRCYQCDQCGNYLDFDGVKFGRGDANYCPNCGARMEEREDK